MLNKNIKEVEKMMNEARKMECKYLSLKLKADTEEDREFYDKKKEEINTLYYDLYDLYRELKGE